MSIKLFDVPRVRQNELTANLRKLKNGYKMSNAARELLGITKGQSADLAIGIHDDGRLIIKAVSADEQRNTIVSKLNMINTTGMVNKLDTFCNHFEITSDKVDGFNIMTASTTTSPDGDDEDTIPPAEKETETVVDTFGEPEIIS